MFLSRKEIVSKIKQRKHKFTISLTPFFLFPLVQNILNKEYKCIKITDI